MAGSKTVVMVTRLVERDSVRIVSEGLKRGGCAVVEIECVPDVGRYLEANSAAVSAVLFFGTSQFEASIRQRFHVKTIRIVKLGANGATCRITTAAVLGPAILLSAAEMIRELLID